MVQLPQLLFLHSLSVMTNVRQDAPGYVDLYDTHSTQNQLILTRNMYRLPEIAFISYI